MVHTVYTYMVYARECVCNFSGFSKRIPKLESTLGRDDVVRHNLRASFYLMSV